MKKLVEARKLIIEAKGMIGNKSNAESFAFKMANSSPYAQIQWLYMTDELQDALKMSTTCYISMTLVRTVSRRLLMKKLIRKV